MYTRGGYTVIMKKIIHRLHRVRGQMESVEEALVSDGSCHEIIPQLLAVKGSVDALVRSYLEMSLDTCIERKQHDTMRQVIKLLIKN